MRALWQLMFGIAVCLALALSLGAQDKAKAKKTKVITVSGNVQMISREKSAITLRKGTTPETVMYNADTKFNMGSSRKNEPSSIDQVKDGNYMYCSCAIEGGNRVAQKCIFRAAR